MPTSLAYKCPLFHRCVTICCLPNMVFFGIVYKLANYSGALVGLHEGNRWYQLLILYNWANAILVLFQSGYFYLINIGDFDSSTKVMGAFMNILMQSTKAFILWKNNRQFVRLFRRLKQLCWDPASPNFARAQQLQDRMNGALKVYFALLIAPTILAWIFTPPLMMLLEYWRTGAVVESRWELAFQYASPFYEVNSSPAYEINYAIFSTGITPLSIYVMSPDLLFMATCLHISGLWRDLRQRLRDALAHPEDRRGLAEVVEYQNAIYGLVEEAQDVFGGVFCTQCMGTLVIVVFLIFVATQLDNAQVVPYLIFGLADLSELLIYVYSGSQITQSHEALYGELLQADWHSWTAEQRANLVVLLRRFQGDCLIRFMNVLPCSEETLQSVLRNSFSVFAILQKMNSRGGF